MVAGVGVGLLPFPDLSPCWSAPTGSAFERSLLIVGAAVGSALVLSVIATEADAPRPGRAGSPVGRVRGGLGSVGVVWLLFGVLVLQHKGIATFTHHLDVNRIPPMTEGFAVLTLWGATGALGVGAVIHTVAVVRTRPHVDSAPAAGENRARSVVFGAAVGVVVTVALCAYVWSVPTFCVVD